MTGFLIGVFFAVVATISVYLVINKLYPTWGTVVTNALKGAIAIPALISQFAQDASSLPWNSVMDAAHAAKVLFTLSISAIVSNIIMRLNGPKNPVGNP